ncbi:precorrin-2 C(20)-methyltransferase [Rhodoblastus acidophilus]|uniref:Precorrin-2 C(20)-methyltransferase n=1 Tax=Candidatus Rhodoblastus alkanivorans TaxID=2954117 RepID=A0ABS9Z8T0_9HYPH|nr:precorrin-2 C(20)-methyltransferase [Candidatus Rhodoblastus alkanivorans]MCI4679289.1 precorrin-2 C(20)-methyltransferase [Candidatus Rhodoblastus alkanivorans]MCI4684084.1 precorrin-2 C(20)-methyltransferase [Candidatus Rhodoblastus alkanivorans]MDI4641404.1 precorrin-2 C(20)-methyltransferase [Rhodoblastus acidophilus]
MNMGRLYGVGLGPGDPELVTVKAVRVIESAAVVAFFAKTGRQGNARTIADRWIPAKARELPLNYPVTTEIPVSDPAYNEMLRAFYQEATEKLAAELAAGNDVALLAEGDPLFYGSFMHLYIRLRERFPVTIVPGVTGMAGCWAAAGETMTWGDDVMTILPGTLPLETLADRLKRTDAAVIMKVGKNFAKVRQALRDSGHYERAIYVERGTMSGEKIVKLSDKADDSAPYFAIVLVSGQGRRP